MAIKLSAMRILAVLALLLLAPAGAGFAQSDQRCFPETGYCISGRIRQFWEQNGGLAVFGFPITEQRQELNRENQIPFQTQWFERTRLELHFENQRPYDVLLGRLGDDRLRQQGRDWQTFPRSTPQDGCRFFAETGQNVCGPILRAWRANGLEFDGRPGASEAESLALYGLPISPLIEEVIEGRIYVVQHFERARFEQHPENAFPYDVLLGRLGDEVRVAARASGRELAYVGGEGALYTIPASGIGGPTQVRLPDVAPGGVAVIALAWSPDRQRLAVTLSNGKLFVIRPDGAGQQIADNAGPLSWSPDGQRIVFTTYTPAQPFRLGQLAVVNADGSGLRRLTSEGSNIQPQWSPDGRWIAFLTRRLPDAPYFPGVNDHQLALISPEGGELRTLTEIGEGYDAVWSPDSQYLTFSSVVGDKRQIVSRSIVEGSIRIWTAEPDGASNPVWSPDGTRLAYQSTRPGPYNAPMVVANADGGGRREVGFGIIGQTMRWSRDGTQLAYVTDVRTDRRVVVVNADGSGGTPIATGGGPIWR
ncbi:MAG TPA: hypothetical protein VFS21_11290 [Roseiflexaceae bacterium]|nr:hypothetical protein [Roseiflexaceae bacterium]